MLETLIKQIQGITTSPGSYQFLDTNGKVLYVGKAKNLKKRLTNYTDQKRLSTRIARMVSLATKIEIIETITETEALLLECNLIKKFMPRFNILLRDDKSFPYIMITKDHEFGGLAKHRGKKVRKAHYFGPFANIYAVNETIEILKKSFLLRSCSDEEFKSRKKPCLEYQIKRCSAPCVSIIDKKDYNNLVHGAVDFLSGKSAMVQEDLAKKMQFFSQNMEYEKAAIMRDRIKALSIIQAKQNINISSLESADIVTLACKANQCCAYISFYRGGLNYGGKAYFISVNDDESQAQIMEAFLGQFYLEQELPKTLILSHKPEDLENLSAVLNKISARKIEILIPEKGEKFSLVQDQTRTAIKHLTQKLDTEVKDQEMLIELKKLFDLPKVPEKVEVYDNSHTGGGYMIGALIAAGKDGFIKSGYRKFNIRTEELDNRDDTALLRQVLRRRFKNFGKNIEGENFPDLVIIDGGKGQLTAATEIFAELKNDIPFFCMSKGPNRNAGEEYFHQVKNMSEALLIKEFKEFVPDIHSFTLSKNAPLMHYLQRLRDEAHRFAIGTHRARRDKALIKSELDEIPGIGKSRKKLLLHHFGAVNSIKEAALEDLERVKGINKSTAKKVWEFFKK